MFGLKLKVFWHEQFLGLSIQQINQKKLTPVTPYYLWPKTRAWEQLKLELDSRLWLREEEKIEVLNAASEIMNYWKKNRKLKKTMNITQQFPTLDIAGL